MAIIATDITVYYFTDVQKGNIIGSLNEYKIQQMSKKAFCNHYKKCTLADFHTLQEFKRAELHNSEYL